jgi:hypothetical protein
MWVAAVPGEARGLGTPEGARGADTPTRYRFPLPFRRWEIAWRPPVSVAASRAACFPRRHEDWRLRAEPR